MSRKRPNFSRARSSFNEENGEQIVRGIGIHQAFRSRYRIAAVALWVVVILYIELSTLGCAYAPSFQSSIGHSGVRKNFFLFQKGVSSFLGLASPLTSEPKLT